MKRAIALFSCLIALAGCGRVRTVIRGSTSVFLSTDPPPVTTPDPILRSDARLAVLWVGHATMLIQLDDRVVVTDPVLTATVGQLSKRIIAPGLTADRFPAIDLVVISHVHYDHLSFGSLSQLESKIGFLALPQTGLNYLPDYRFDAAEVPTWTSITVTRPAFGGSAIERHGVRATSVPARHFGWRWVFDDGKAFGGWVLEHAGLTVYFAGDTGYDHDMCLAIRKRFPHIDLALLPIAPLEPHSLMKAWHMNAQEAVQAFVDLGAKQLVPLHFDTFVNSLDAPADADLAYLRARDAAGLDDARAPLLQIGERRILVKK